ncbi:MAG: prepilin-type N-terminal cleavage/methylation domain-containing protein [Candidatus Riflebacteria bacterium]|nr:prepilin-type N-terminal cleavage/methylation domain-containing protein [Candidatus Riflebacteria bacterium]
MKLWRVLNLKGKIKGEYQYPNRPSNSPFQMILLSCGRLDVAVISHIPVVCHGRERRGGFTAIEFMIVLAIVWVIVAMSGSNLGYHDVKDNGQKCFYDRADAVEYLNRFQTDGKGNIATFSDADLREGGAWVAKGILRKPFVSHTTNFVQLVPECIYEAVAIASDPDSLPHGIGRDHVAGFRDCEAHVASSEMRSMLEFQVGSEPRLLNCIVHGPYPVVASSPRLITHAGVKHYLFDIIFFGPFVIVGLVLFVSVLSIIFYPMVSISKRKGSSRRKDWMARDSS